MGFLGFSGARRVFFVAFKKCFFRQDTRGLVCLKGGGENSVNFASLVEVVAAHTAENESPQVLALFSLRTPHMYFCVFSVGPRGKSDRINLAKPASSVFMLSHMAGLGPPYFRYFLNKPRRAVSIEGEN